MCPDHAAGMGFCTGRNTGCRDNLSGKSQQGMCATMTDNGPRPTACEVMEWADTATVAAAWTCRLGRKTDRKRKLSHPLASGAKSADGIGWPKNRNSVIGRLRQRDPGR